MELIELWLPVVLSAAAVWIVSTIFGMPFLHHKNDWIGLPAADEEGLMEHLRSRGIKAGNYLFPDFRTREAMESEKTKVALEQGPVGHLSLWQPPLGMAGKMAATMLVHLAASTLIAYLASLVLPRGTAFLRVFHVVVVAGVLAYCFAFLPNAIWFGAYRRTIFISIIDGVVYGIIIALIFAWRWPH